MRTSIFSILLCLLYGNIYAQNSKNVLTELITYKVNLRLDPDKDTALFRDANYLYREMNTNWYNNKLNNMSYEMLVNQVHTAAITGKLPVKEPIFFLEGSKPIFTRMSPQAVASLGTDTMIVTLYRPYPPYDAFDTTIVRMFDPLDIIQIEFMEKWIINPKNMTIKKELIAYSFWRKRLDPDSGEYRGMSCMYWVPYKKQR